MVEFTGVGAPATGTPGVTAIATGTAATAATVPVTVAPAMAKTYQTKYANMVDILHQTYASLYSKADLLSTATPEELRDHAIVTRNVLPKVYICLFEGMALLCGKVVDKDVIRLVGRWKSDAMFRYLHAQALPLVHNLAASMLQYGSFRLIQGHDVPPAVQHIIPP